jgi:tRNA-splicing ligase RtcB
MIEKKDFKRIDKYIWELPKDFRGDMRVPARIIADEVLFAEAFRDRSPEQLANTATLPGVVRYVMAMPDMHLGYGPPIGGVIPVRYPEGIISPGAVGYDINCIAGDSLVLHKLGYVVPIRDMAIGWEDAELWCQDFDLDRTANTEVVNYLQRRSSRPVYRVMTDGGDEIIATGDHPFWTPDGMMELGSLGLGDQVAVFPYEGVEYESPSSETIVTHADVEAILLMAGKQYGRGGIPKAIKGLERRGLLPLSYDSPSLPYLLKLLGYAWGDGTMNFCTRRLEGVLTFYGKFEDIEAIRADLKRLGYGPTRTRERRRRHRINHGDVSHEFVGSTCHVEVRSTGLVALLTALGSPLGKKAEQDFVLPDWLYQAPLWQKRLFLSGLFGAELSKPALLTSKKHQFQRPKLSLSKREPFLDSGYEFLEGIADLLGEFGVEAQNICRERGRALNKDGTYSHILRLPLSSRSENLIALWSRVGFEYNRERQSAASVAVQYLKCKQVSVQDRREARAVAVSMYADGFKPAQIQRQLSDYGVNLRFVEPSIYEDTPDVYVRRSFPSFDEYAVEATAGLGESGMVWARIARIEPLDDFDEDVYDFTVAHRDHNFIANGFVVSNCGVRLLSSHLEHEEVAPYLQDLTAALYQSCPSGVGGKGRERVSGRELDELVTQGAKWALKRGLARQEDLAHTEEGGRLPGADPAQVSARAKERGRPQVGSLGAGNHFLEIDVVEEIYDADVADAFGLFEDQIAVQIHCGSRGFGHQVCDDYVKGLQSAVHKYKITLPDRELVCAPLDSPEGRAYYGAMACAVNYAFVNRQVLAMGVREAFERVLAGKVRDFDLFQVYDVCHNIAKFEEHEVDGRRVRLCVHRKGATRAFGPGRAEVPADYRDVGQPVLVPGSMGTESYVLVGTQEAMDLTFGSTCHGAGRVMSRSRAIKQIQGGELRRELESQGIVVRAGSNKGLAEEAPAAYKDVSRVVEVVHGLGIARKVACLRPLGVIKG